MRVGFGTDLHRMVEGIPLRIGGVIIDHDKGPHGHSDGDVVLHALTDAILGAAGLGDIGEMFPDTDEGLAGMDSRVFVERAVEEAVARGFAVENADIVIHAESPRIGPHREAIRESVAGVLGISPDRVGVKAKTGEGIGEIGRGEAIAADGVVLLREGR